MLIIFFIFIAIINYFGLKLFILIAEKNNIVAIGNNKNMHQGSIPRGGGLIFGSAYIILITSLYLNNSFQFNFFLPVIFGSFSCLLLGFLDDVYDFRITTKLVSQILIILILIFNLNFMNMYQNSLILNTLNFVFITIFISWMLNAFNFLDGSDGHLSCIAIMQCILMIVGLYINNEIDLILPLFFLLSVILVFLNFNWPPARVFMGDAGSLFIGINFIIFIIISIQNSFLTPYLILIIFSYFFIDTLGTLVLRVFLKKSFRFRHRSHPYQNFSRIFNHKKTLVNVIAFHMVWLLPIVVFGSLYESYQIYLTIIAILPLLIFLIKFGPLFSSD